MNGCQKSNMADNMTDITEQTTFDELCANCEQMELDVSKRDSVLKRLSHRVFNFLNFAFENHLLA